MNAALFRIHFPGIAVPDASALVAQTKLGKVGRMHKLNSFACTAVLLLFGASALTACGDDGGSGANAGNDAGGTSSSGGQGGQISSGNKGGQISSGNKGGETATGGQSAAGGASASGSLVAAMSLNFLSGGTNCPIPTGYDDFPSVSGSHPVTAAGATLTTPDNVTSSRGAVRVQCSIGGAIVGVSISFGGGTQSIAFRAGSPGNLLYVPLNSKVTYGATAAAPCNIEALSTSPSGGLYAVNCPTLTGDDGSTCVLGESYIYFSGCTQK